MRACDAYSCTTAVETLQYSCVATAVHSIHAAAAAAVRAVVVVGWAHAAGSHCLACCERAPRALQPLHRPATRGLSSAAPVHPSRGSVRRGAPPLPPRDARGCRCRRPPPRVTGGALLAVSRARNVFLERRRVSPCPTHTLCPCSVCGDGRSTAGTPPPRRVLWLLTLDAVMQGDVGLLG
jgi:hypothetical protein